MRSAIVGFVAAMLAACAGPRPNAPSNAAVVAPAAWRDGASGGEVTAEWWQAFGDPALTRIVEHALADNVDIAIAAARVEEARAQFGAARGQLLPSVELFAGAKRERFLNAFGQPASQTAERTEIDISYDLDLFGRLRNASEAARASLLATQAARDNVTLAVASSAAAGYIGLRALDARLAVVRETVDARAGSLKIAQRRAQSGYATRLELEQAEAELHATEQLVPALQLAITRQENGLSVLLGENPRAIERGVALSDLTMPAVPPMLPSESLSRSRRRTRCVSAHERAGAGVAAATRDALARALVQAGNRYRAGYSSYLEQLDAQRGLLSADLSLVQASNDRLSAAVSLFQALGGGWTEGKP